MKRPCGCCEGTAIATPAPEYNRPGLPALSYRVGCYGTFFESMVARLSTVYVDVPGMGTSSAMMRVYPLRVLTTRELSDPSIALLDAWAVVADVLTFYQERIANEGYLATATERLSLLELAALIGYKPRPGVAASVFLAFTTSAGFMGVIPAGTRAQSIPGTGETSQYFETSDDLAARDTWNTLGPRLTRPMVISPPPGPELQLNNHLGTNADVIDGLYFEGIATNLKAGDPVLLVLSDDPGEQFLRFAESVDAQANQGRTHVALREPAAEFSGGLPDFVRDALQRFVNDASEQFPGSDVASDMAALLSQIIPAGVAEAASLARSAIPAIQTALDVAVKREFRRLETWLQHLLDVMPAVARALVLEAGRGSEQKVLPRPSVTLSSLQRLGSVLPSISIERSVPPANSLRLQRSAAGVFAAHADTIPRLLAALHPTAAPSIYAAWGGVQPVHIDLHIYAARAKATLFASTFAGASAVVQSQATTGTSTSINFTPATLLNSWGDLIPGGVATLDVLALDSVYDKVTVDSWVVVDQPAFDANGTLTGERVVSYHQVTDVKVQTLDTTKGFTAKVSVLTLDRSWIPPEGAASFATLIAQPMLLRGTVVYAQTEELSLAEEPLDRDVEGDSIELDGLYDGLEPGRWVIVSGERTDVPNTAGVMASELAMISSVTQGAGKQMCAVGLPQFVPFESLFYISDENANGDRIVVGAPTSGLISLLNQIPLPGVLNQQFCEVIELCPGIFANAYVPTAVEKGGDFGSFADQFIDPSNPNSRLAGGVIPSTRIDKLFAWRIRSLASASETVHTTIQFANALAYTYNATGINIYANVAKATHGQTTGEILGNGDASQAFQQFSLHQTPVTYVSTPTAAGAQSTLAVSVNELLWQEADDLAALAARDRDYVTTTDDSDQTTVIFGNGVHGARVPTGSSNVKATYRYGIGSVGNVGVGQISQLATHPLGLQGVVNPIEASGGADRDSLEQVRSNAPLAVLALDRLVSVQDYSDFTRTFAGIGKAAAVKISDGRRQVIHVTIAGVGDIPIDATSDLYQNLVLSLQKFGDPELALQVCARRAKLLVISAGVQLMPNYLWESVAPQIRTAVLALFSFDARDLAEPAFQSEAVAAIQSVEGVLYVDMRVFDAVADSITVDELGQLAGNLKRKPFVRADVARLDPNAAPGASACTRIRAAELVYLTPDIPDTFLLTQIGV